MKKSNANALWNGTLKDGKGTMKFTGYEGPYTFASRFESGEETNPEDVEGMRAAVAILTARGGMTSHAALVARGWGKCCIVGAGTLQIDLTAKKLMINGSTFLEGDVFTLIDLGNGTLALKPSTSKVAAHGDEVSRIMADEDVNLDNMLQALDEERQDFYKDQYVNP